MRKMKKKTAKAKKTKARKPMRKSVATRKKTAKKVTKKKKTSKAKSKAKKVSAVPRGYNSVTPYLIVSNAVRAIEFYKKVFNAKEVMRMQHPNQKVGHAELRIGDAKIMLADEFPEMGAQGPEAFGGSPVGIYLYIKDVDDVVRRAINEGATLLRPVENMFYGDRCGAVEDPYGHKWYVSTHVEDVTPAQLKKRAQELFGSNI